MAQFETFYENKFKPPRRIVIDNNPAYSSNNYLHINITTNIIVNNSELDNKISIN